jgi:hypothetical protein
MIATLLAGGTNPQNARKPSKKFFSRRVQIQKMMLEIKSMSKKKTKTGSKINKKSKKRLKGSKRRRMKSLEKIREMG